MLFEEPKAVQSTRIGPAAIRDVGIQWVKPDRASGRVLFEIQEYRL
jgi:hypothetical protein